jgi:pimeloyl-ACP methyl ester carboxylesterase
MITQHHAAPGSGGSRVLLIMLPGVGSEVGEFAEEGMIAAVHARGLAVDIIAARPELELYLDGNIAEALHREIVEPALARGYKRIWLLGISLGGMGALLYASSHAREVEGLVLLAPFLGTRGTVAELEKAGGLAFWSPPGSAATEIEQRALLWMQDYLVQRRQIPAVYLGYGSEDRFAPGHRIIGELLAGDHVVTEAGGHDWQTWLALWQRVLDSMPFSGKLA